MDQKTAILALPFLLMLTTLSDGVYVRRVHIGDNVTLLWNLSNKSSINCYDQRDTAWFVVNQQALIFKNEKKDNEKIQIFLNSNMLQTVMLNVSLADAGRYTCTTINFTEVNDIFVWGIPTRPIIDVSSSQLKCNVNSTSLPERFRPNMTYTWLRDGSEIETKINVFKSVLQDKPDLYDHSYSCRGRETGSTLMSDPSEEVVVGAVRPTLTVPPENSQSYSTEASTNGSPFHLKLIIALGAFIIVLLLSTLVSTCILIRVIRRKKSGTSKTRPITVIGLQDSPSAEETEHVQPYLMETVMGDSQGSLSSHGGGTSRVGQQSENDVSQPLPPVQQHRVAGGGEHELSVEDCNGSDTESQHDYEEMPNMGPLPLPIQGTIRNDSINGRIPGDPTAPYDEFDKSLSYDDEEDDNEEGVMSICDNLIYRSMDDALASVSEAATLQDNSSPYINTRRWWNKKVPPVPK